MKHYLFTTRKIKYNKWFITEIFAIANIDECRYKIQMKACNCGFTSFIYLIHYDKQ